MFLGPFLNELEEIAASTSDNEPEGIMRLLLSPLRKLPQTAGSAIRAGFVVAEALTRDEKDLTLLSGIPH